ncbi:hypothetical protein ACFY4C_39645 [Actinomadura viridis]|uniref:hypothetical protein n=1 Tax=Actinomadura viridis TaxID=58110 RepID=UPI0036AC5058
MPQAILKDGELLLPHPVGDGVTLINPDHPNYQELRDGAIDWAALRGTPQQNRAAADRLRAKLARQDRRTA